MPEPLRTVLIGCGNRGQMFGRMCRDLGDMARIVALADPRDDWRALEAKNNDIPPEHAYRSFEEALGADSPTADLAIIAASDRVHYAAAMLALEKGCNVLLEKPIAQRPDQAVHMARTATRKGLQVAVQHELRYSPFFRTVREIVQSGHLGRIYSYTHTEHVSYWHFTHSFVRGNYGDVESSNATIVAKACHDLDLIPWVLDDEVTKVSSLGRLDHYTARNRPEGAPERCTDGCPAAETCVHNAAVFYLGPRTDWPVAMIGTDMSQEARRRRLAASPYGRCVYGGYNDAVDHQSVMMETRHGTLCTLTMHGFSAQEECGRKIRLDGTAGTLRGDMGRGQIMVYERVGAPYGTKVEPEVIELGDCGGHGGGDARLFEHVLRCFHGGKGEPLAILQNSIESHLIGWAAEQARLESRVVIMDEFRAKAHEAADRLG
jgi:predicted dehydrogenase